LIGLRSSSQAPVRVLRMGRASAIGVLRSSQNRTLAVKS
jgi:hypothetical protein